MTQPSTCEQILDYSNRANPYPLYAELRKTPVARQEDGSYVVSTYAEIAALLHDPRVSSDITRNPAAVAAGAAAVGDDDDGPGMTPTFLSMDPPEHDKFRRMAMRHFGPPDDAGQGRRDGGEDCAEIVTELIDNMSRARHGSTSSMTARIRCPVTVICELLGVPPGDEQRFRVWVDVALQIHGSRTRSRNAAREESRGRARNCAHSWKNSSRPTGGHRATTCSRRWPPMTARKAACRRNSW